MNCLTEYDEKKTMNLFKEEYLKQGKAEGKAEIIANMLKKHKSAREIAELCDIPIDYVREIERDILCAK